MTLGLAIFFFAILMIYCGVKNKSLTQALLGHAVAGSSGSLLSTGTSGAPAAAPTAGTSGIPSNVSGTFTR